MTDLTLLHPPSIFRFRELPCFLGPVSDVIPSTSIFEGYPIGFLTLSEYLTRHGFEVRVVNLALKMLRDRTFDAERFTAGLKSRAFGIDLHWLPHVDGSLGLAEQLKRQHPDVPVILGGLSATYFRDELMRDHPYVDFVVCGDSTEEPLRLLLEALRNGGGFERIPNLVWRREGLVVDNGISWRPDTLDHARYDYAHFFRMLLKYRDPVGYLPYLNWLEHPVLAVFTCRGCNHDCSGCGASSSAFSEVCVRTAPAFRSPQLLADDIAAIADHTGAPIMIIGDLLQAGPEYADAFFTAIGRHRIANELAVEFFHPPSRRIIERLSESIAHFNVELSPESHDIRVRRAFGKQFDNRLLEESLEALVASPCRRIDLFFMVGLPEQSYASVQASVAYCGDLLERFGAGGKLLPFLAPLAPFVDPGSRAFQNPEEMGYRLFYRSLADHRRAMLMPSWKQRLNYETAWMTRDEIVSATYDGAEALVVLKERHGLVSAAESRRIREQIERARRVVARLDSGDPPDAALREEIRQLNRLDTLCGKHELDWRVSGSRYHLFRCITSLFHGRP
ncbi:TIGR04190 family B12-binding domain/radical SAM domain protein [Trichlorobacter ammonificans]|uniref:B12-binding domain-containing protein n=1 Tax=Trichlorobacter ammonificans TaxID=2916410 RepID=A0ABN8HLT1_9BACT|nr:TIGR04190 family B12-binding domain/radical SAM domain protein [Trichlorobacter ammonificans]CAH2032133.1 B12-binding domain-containing protein [Trichlorobacter ammonificans]